MLSWKQLFHSVSFLPLITLLTCPFHLPALFPQAYLLLESTRPFGSTTIYHTALDFDPLWPFSQLLDPIQFPHVLLVIVEPGPLCWWMPFSPSILPWATLWCSNPAFLSSRQLSHMPQLWWGRRSSQVLQCNSGGPSGRKYLHFYIYYYSYQILCKKKKVIGEKKKQW